MGEGGFEPPKALLTDLQSAPFGHSGIPPYCAVNGAGRRTRTPDLLITNQLLYQLSYTGILKDSNSLWLDSKRIISTYTPFVNNFFLIFKKVFPILRRIFPFTVLCVTIGIINSLWRDYLMLPAAFLERMKRLLGNEYADFLSSYERPRNTGLRLNPKKRADVSRYITAPIVWEPNGFYQNTDTRPGLSALHEAGVYYLQEPSAMAPARLLNAQPGEVVLDLCAAPGGKSTQIAASMNGQGLLVCNEIHPKRARILSSNIERMGVGNALVLNEHPAKLAERFPEFFDRILVDAPCSGEGMFRKEDAAIADWSEETVAMCAARQSEILCSAAKMLKPGGRLVYSTCTFSPEENEGVISRFLHTHDDFSVEILDVPWFDCGRPEWISDPAEHLEHTFRLWPHKLRGEGHFAAVLRREGESSDQKSQPSAAVLPEEICSFLEENKIHLSGIPVEFGSTWFLAPEALPELKELRVLRAGLELGELRKGRFMPAHALALWLKNYPVTADYPAESAEISAYLRGETLRGTQTGWTLVTVGGISLGWAKGAGGILKNHYPKGLRRF